MKPIPHKDLRYTYNCNGYMLYYKNKPIGGGGSNPDKPRRGAAVKSNEEFFRTQAMVTMNQICEGRIHPYMKQAIIEIQEEVWKV